jgi:hypothetical protein
MQAASDTAAEATAAVITAAATAMYSGPATTVTVVQVELACSNTATRVASPLCSDRAQQQAQQMQVLSWFHGS